MGSVTSEMPYPRSVKIEVIVSVSGKPSRIDSVDIDNLLKSVLDCMNGIVYEDDSQIINVLGSKHIHPVAPIPGLLVGVRRIKNEEDSWFDWVKLAYAEYEE